MMWNVDMWREVDRLRKDMDTIFSGYGRGAGPTYPLLNVYDDKDNVTVTAELPGMAKDKVDITFADGLLTIAGKQDAVGTPKNMTVVRQERSTGAFEKSLRIPSKIEQDRIGASFADGILTITLPKSEDAKPKTITIEAQ